MSGFRDDLAPAETELVGQWLDTGNRIVGDATADRIAWLTRGESHREPTRVIDLPAGDRTSPMTLFVGARRDATPLDRDTRRRTM